MCRCSRSAPARRGGPPNRRWNAPVGHRQALAVVEIVHVQPETAVGLEVDQVLRGSVPVDRPAVGRQAHQLVFAAVDLEAAVVSECRVKQPERVRKLRGGAVSSIRLPRPTPIVVVLHSPTPSSVRIAASSNGTREKGAGRMALVVVRYRPAACAGRAGRGGWSGAGAACL